MFTGQELCLPSLNDHIMSNTQEKAQTILWCAKFEFIIRFQRAFISEYFVRSPHNIAEAVSRWLPTAASRVRAWVWQVGFVVDKVTSGQVFSEYFCFPYQYHSFHQILRHHNHPGQTRIGLASSWSPVQRVQLTVLDLENWNKTKVSWRRPRPKIGL
jgi:hypothetical protein